MHYCSTQDEKIHTSFSKAVLQGLAPEGGLFVPNEIPPVSKAIYDKERPVAEIAVDFLRPYVKGAITDRTLKSILSGALNFPIPLKEVEDNIYALELFHGPTLAFKDIGARFMGRVLPLLNQDQDDLVVLVATSGDTGGAVANGLLNVPGVRVIVLYPDGKVSPLQEKQFASLGGNIQALAVDGVFDDCQRLVKAAFDDAEIAENYNLTTANSINIARWLPQAVYYFSIYAQLGEEAVISVPSGNLGNFTAAILAHQSGLPVRRFISACNVNDTFPQFISSGKYTAKPSIETVANAMDVGDPSNFERFEYFARNEKVPFQNLVKGVSYTDRQILDTVIDCHRRTDYLLDPHGACGYRALKEQLAPGEKGVFLATAHPAKFAEVYGKIGLKLPVHASLEALRNRKLIAHKIPAKLADLKKYLDE